MFSNSMSLSECCLKIHIPLSSKKDTSKHGFIADTTPTFKPNAAAIIALYDAVPPRENVSPQTSLVMLPMIK